MRCAQRLPRIRLALLTMWWLMVAVAFAWGEPLIKTVRTVSSAGVVQVFVDLSEGAAFRYSRLPGNAKSAARVYVDVEAAPSSDMPIVVGANNGMVERIRTGKRGKVTRIVVELNRLDGYSVTSSQDGRQIVMSFTAGKESMPPQVRGRRSSASPEKPARGRVQKGDSSRGVKTAPVQVPATAGRNRALRRIVVDAGHGGKDPGAMGHGLQEKDVTLNVARRLAAAIRENLGCEVVMTRSTDVFIPLQKRTEKANQVHADLFISVHVNSSTNSRLRGVETYFLDFSKNRDAMRVVARENGTTLKEVGDLQIILYDLIAHSKSRESSVLASQVQQRMIGALRRHYGKVVENNGVKQGPFHVLLGANMPSILVEMAYISNSGDADFLKDYRYLNGVVEGIVEGIRGYKSKMHPLDP
ncbi:MAG: N-acetylmuramoyl-L-alanine amidase [Deltaproteobacteria bacterium]|nr:N-acetylmuramoyl-L-alanine amidase [Deltaproteobacteria bacterium]